MRKKYYISALLVFFILISYKATEVYIEYKIESINKQINSLKRERKRIIRTIDSLKNIDVVSDKDLGVYINELLYKVFINEYNYTEHKRTLDDLNIYRNYLRIF